MKKHACQMTEREKGFLAERVSSVANWQFSLHASERMRERNASHKEVLDAIRSFQVVEFNCDRGRKVLVRGNGSVNGKQVCAVVAPESKKVVTVYFNDANDHHKTLNLKAYQAQLDVLIEYWKH